MKVNLHRLAVLITKLEGKKIHLSVAQVKEVLKITLNELGKLPIEDIIMVLMEAKLKK